MGHRRSIPRDDQWSEGDVRRLLTNVFHVPLGMITAESWMAAIVRLIQDNGAEATVRQVVRSFNEVIEGLGEFDQALDEDQYLESFAPKLQWPPSLLAEALFDDLLPRAQRYCARPA